MRGEPVFVVLPFLLFSFCLIAVQSAEDLSGSARLLQEEDGGGVCAGSEKPSGCPINCFRSDPVCGADGVTYWCGCLDAACNGAHVVKAGACDAENHGSASIPGQALLLVHIVWLIVLAFSLVVGLF